MEEDVYVNEHCRLGRRDPCGRIRDVIWKEEEFFWLRQRVEGFGYQESTCAKVDRKTKGVLFRDRKLQLILLSTSCIPGTHSVRC